jgi:hypothetical protein
MADSKSVDHAFPVDLAVGALGIGFDGVKPGGFYELDIR